MANGGMTNGVGGPGGNGNGEFFDEDDEDEYRWFSVGICKYKPGYKSDDLL